MRDTLRELFLAARAEKSAVTIKRARPDPAGPTWIPKDDKLVIAREASRTDRKAAANPLQKQLQVAIRDGAADLATRAVRLSNSPTWSSLPNTAEAFRTTLDCDSAQMPDRLGLAYAYLLHLGQFLETDVRVQRDRAAIDNPLDHDIHGSLSNLVRLAAPWLRSFPTIAAWDDAAGKALVRKDLLQPAREFTRIARAQHAISDKDAAEMEVLAEAADPTDYQGQKASTRSIAGAKNLLLAAAGTLATFYSGAVASDFATRSELVQRVGATLALAEAQVEAFAATMQTDLRYALRTMVMQGKDASPDTPALLPDRSGAVRVPEDVEEQAHGMILDGYPPPQEWIPYIRRLDFTGSRITRLDLLSKLTALVYLDLTASQAHDVNALSGLVDLSFLVLREMPIRDVSPLSRLTHLTTIDLARTRVSDVSPLAALKSLRMLVLAETPISDLPILSARLSLNNLDLTSTRVRDLSPLSTLVGLRVLHLVGTPVDDIGPLSSLTELRGLELGSTAVSDVSSLAALTELEYLDLSYTAVSDVSALSTLTNLKTLDLTGTYVQDVSSLNHIRPLRIAGFGLQQGLAPSRALNAFTHFLDGLLKEQWPRAGGFATFGSFFAQIILPRLPVPPLGWSSGLDSVELGYRGVTIRVKVLQTDSPRHPHFEIVPHEGPHGD